MSDKPREMALRFGRDLQTALGERLRSVVLFGSAARDEAIPGVSDVNVLVLMDRVDPQTILAAAPLAQKWAGKGNTPPLVLAWDEVPVATDAFAIEFSDMKDAHVPLLGESPIPDLEVDPGDLRLQAERELRGKLVQLREGMLLTATEPEQVGRLLELALPSFVTYQRALLRLAGEAVPQGTDDVVRRACAAVGASPEPFLRVAEARRRRARLRVAIDDPVVTGYYSLAERTAAYVDSLSEMG